ncbi:hypothetical protein PMZ86_18650 [Escherichia coli]|uniref:hypothetical protein n=1 Tax=Escherichia coli TaxID=562 RepID=UPI00189D9825|nr:hypothetical protein [Escherichia coli]MDB6994097.1 hypothetical protein [Escherichia coli]
MLDSIAEVNAFKILNASGTTTPASITLSKTASSNASSLEENIQALILKDKAYPASVVSWVNQLSVFSEQLKTVSAEATNLADSLSPYTSPTELLQMKIGWECYVKGNDLSPAPEFALVTVMGDTLHPQSLIDALAAFELVPITSAMTAINAKVQASSGEASGNGSSTGTTQQPALTEEEIKALKDAVEAATEQINAINNTSSSLSTLTQQVKDSTGNAKQGLENAVAITLTGSLLGDEVMSPAISLIMPQGVIDALQSNTKREP